MVIGNAEKKRKNMKRQVKLENFNNCEYKINSFLNCDRRAAGVE